MDGWLIFLGLFTAYILFVYYLRSRTTPMRLGFELNGPFVMWRTQLGKNAIEKVSRPRRFWNVVADGGIILTWLMGALIFAFLAFLFILQVAAFFDRPEAVAQNAQSPEFLLGIPGVNPLIPVGYGAVAIILALIIHEGSHGVMAYASRMRVKSLGLLFFIVPVGAFVEPDEEDLEKSTTREKNRVFAAGPTSNIVLALVAGTLLSTVFLAAIVPTADHGTLVTNVNSQSGADLAGLKPGDRILSVDGQRVNTRDEYALVLNSTYDGQQIGVDYVRDGQVLRTEARLSDKRAYYEELGITHQATLNEATGKGFLGMSVAGAADLNAGVKERLQYPLASLGNFLYYNLYPLYIFSTNVDIFAAPYSEFFHIEGPLAALPPVLVFGGAALLYWIVWINVTLATFNALPMGPLDGGQMFRATLRDRLMRRYNVTADHIVVERAEMGGTKITGKDPETQVKLDKINGVVKRTTWTLGFSILGLIVIPIVVPWVLRVFY